MTSLPKVLDEIVSDYKKERYPKIKQFLLQNVNKKMNERLLDTTSEYIYSELEPFMTEKDKSTEEDDSDEIQEKYDDKVFDKTAEVLESLVPSFVSDYVFTFKRFLDYHLDTVIKLKGAVDEDDFYIKEINSQKNNAK